MKCRICGSNNTEEIYYDFIRDGAVGRLTSEKYSMNRCMDCHTIWREIHEGQYKQYYESEQYRIELENDSSNEHYYDLHDGEVLEKLKYTGTSIFRGKRVADIGAGGGSFLDFLNGVAKTTIAIEPSELYRREMEVRGHLPYAYAKDAIAAGEKVDIATSFDVIEHVDDPIEFVKDVYNLLDDGGVAFIGTPTDAPILRSLLGHTYEQFLFSYQHPWVLSAKSFEQISRMAGFSKVQIRQVQRYGLSNAMIWLNEKKPKGHSKLEFIPESLEEHFKRSCEELKLADYIVSVVEK